jgi:hypothetical protein
MWLWSAGAFSVMLVLAACSSTGAAGTATSAGKATSASTSSSTVRSGVPTPTLYAPDPALREAQSPDPHFDYGFVVQITAQGFHPQWLVSGCCKPVTWENMTSSTASVVFDHQLVNSGPIPPGGKFVWTPPNVESVTYHAESDPAKTGALQVNQMFES